MGCEGVGRGWGRVRKKKNGGRERRKEGKEGGERRKEGREGRENASKRRREGINYRVWW